MGHPTAGLAQLSLSHLQPLPPRLQAPSARHRQPTPSAERVGLCLSNLGSVWGISRSRAVAVITAVITATARLRADMSARRMSVERVGHCGAQQCTSQFSWYWDYQSDTAYGTDGARGTPVEQITPSEPMNPVGGGSWISTTGPPPSAMGVGPKVRSVRSRLARSVTSILPGL